MGTFDHTIPSGEDPMEFKLVSPPHAKIKFWFVITPGSADPAFPETFALIVPACADKYRSGFTPSANVNVVGAIVTFEAYMVAHPSEGSVAVLPCPIL